MNGFIFTVIIPAYNAEKYISESIESVVSQTIGFESNIQIIVVNDGSTDTTCECVQHYINMYPTNIQLISKTNAGVSSARNAAFESIQGKYVTMLDADDRWNVNAFKIAYEFFEMHEDEISILSCRTQYFGAKYGFPAKKDYQFATSKIANIFENYSFIQTSASSVFYKSEILKKFRFNENVKYAEDIRFINELLFEVHTFGILRESVYYYRRTHNPESITNSRTSNSYWYTAYFDDVIWYLIDKSMARFGRLLPYIQCLIAHDIDVRFSYGYSPQLTDIQLSLYLDRLSEVVSVIEPKYTLMLPNTSIPKKAAMLYFMLKDKKLVSNEIKKIIRVLIDEIRIEQGRITISGRDRIEYLIRSDIFIENEAGKRYPLKRKNNAKYNSTSLTGDILYKGTTFSVSLPLVELTDYKFILEDEEKNKQVLKLFCSSTCSIPQGDVSPFPFMKRKLTVNKKSISIHK